MPTLGKDCTFTGAGISNANVRSATYALSARELDTQPYGALGVGKYSVGWEGAIELELIEDPSLQNTLKFGGTVSVTSGMHSGKFLITNLVRSEPLDDIVTVRVTLKPFTWQ